MSDRCDCGTDDPHTHSAECASVAWIKDTIRRLQPQLDEMMRLRRKAEAEARFHVIG